MAQIGLVANDLSDQYTMFAILNAKPRIRNTVERYLVHDFSNFDQESFENKISNFDLNYSQIYEINDKFSAFHNHFRKCIDKFSPLRGISGKEYRFKQKPWISESIKKSIQIKNRLKKLVLHHNRSDLRDTYIKYKKTLNKTLEISKRNYFIRKVHNLQRNSKVIWDTYEILKIRNKKAKKCVTKLKISDDCVSKDPLTIAQKLNEYFVNVVVELANKITHQPCSFEKFF